MACLPFPCKHITALTALLCILCSPCGATERQVPSQYPNIQAALDDCDGGDIVIVAPDIYTGPGNWDLDFNGLDVTLRSQDGPHNTIIDCNHPSEDHRAFNFHSQEDAHTFVSGFAIRYGSNNLGGAVYCDQSSPTFTHCILAYNHALDSGGAVYCTQSDPTFVNCTLSGNVADTTAGAFYCDDSSPTLTNCILWNNVPNEIVVASGSPVAEYCAVQGGFGGTAILDADPCFVDPTGGDFHLRSAIGRFDAGSNTWVMDSQMSPSIDAGDLSGCWMAELYPHGRRGNLGAFGGTPQASLSGSAFGYRADLNHDGRVEWLDLIDYALQWSQDNPLSPANLNRADSVNLADFVLLKNEWQILDQHADDALGFAADQLAGMTQVFEPNQYPSYTIDYGSWRLFGPYHWTSGFFPASLWRTYEQTAQGDYLTWARTWTAELEEQAATNATQDLGFMIYNTFGTGYRLTGDPNYLPVVLQAAETVATRYSPVVGLLRSFDWGAWQYPVNIDSLMSVELLIWASQNGGSSGLYDIAVSHATHIMNDHVRPDGSTAHIIDYDPCDGSIIGPSTWQGYAPDSTWARAQAWGIYGFTVMYRETNDPNFLTTAQRMADFFIDHVPPDRVPFWDFDAPGIPYTNRDTSAAAIACSALFELSSLSPEAADQARFHGAACDILSSLCTPAARDGYLARDADNNPISPGVLMQGCYHHPDGVSGGNTCDESLSWGDYYFIEALLRYFAIGPP